MAATDLKRLVFETVKHDFVVDQVNAYLAAGLQVIHAKPEVRCVLRPSGAERSDAGVKIAFADANIAAMSVNAPEPLDIYVLRP